jgi:predicted permease
MSGFAQLLFLLLMILGMLFIWSMAGFIYAIRKYANDPPPSPPQTEQDCIACAYLCAFASSLTFQEQLIMFPNLVTAFIACKIADCDCE